jgi:hypothetical protein
MRYSLLTMKKNDYMVSFLRQLERSRKKRIEKKNKMQFNGKRKLTIISSSFFLLLSNDSYTAHEIGHFDWNSNAKSTNLQTYLHNPSCRAFFAEDCFEKAAHFIRK